MARHQGKTRARNEASEVAGSARETAMQTTEMMQDVMDRAGRFGADTRQEFAAGSRQFGVLGEQAFAAWMQSSNETLRRVLELNVELAAWSREQLDDSIGAVRSLAQCRSFGDAYGVQLGLMRASMENSLRHANKVFSLTANAMAAGARAAQPQGGQD